MKPVRSLLFSSLWIAASFAASPSLAQSLPSPTVETRPAAAMGLNDAIQRALVKSPLLGAAQSTVDAAKGAEQQSGYWPNPEIAIEAENIGGRGAYQGFDSAEVTYGVEQTFEIGGKRGARMSVAKAAREAASAEANSARLNLIKDVTIAYMEAAAAEQKLGLAEEQRRLAEDVRANVNERVNAAREPKIQSSKAEVSYVTAQIFLTQAAREADIAKRKLASFWGETFTAFSLDHQAFFNTVPPDAIDSYTAKLKDSPDMQKFQYQLQERKAALDLEKSLAIPDPSVSFGIRDFRESNDQALVLGVSFPIPLLNQNQGNISKASHEAAKTEFEAQSATLERGQALQTAWRQWQTAYEESRILKDQVLPEAENAFNLSRQGYRAGKFPYLEVLDAQRTLFEARGAYQDAVLRLHAARAEVEFLTASSPESKGADNAR